MTTPPINLRCPWCGYLFQALSPANLKLFRTCPNPNLLSADTPSQKVNGKPGRLCRGNLVGVVFALDERGAWKKG